MNAQEAELFVLSVLCADPPGKICIGRHMVVTVQAGVPVGLKTSTGESVPTELDTVILEVQHALYKGISVTKGV